jgi:diguanylate cyclase (GGDEF)-like protein
VYNDFGNVVVRKGGGFEVYPTVKKLSFLKDVKNVYLALVYSMGFIVFMSHYEFPARTLNEWVMLYALVGSVVLLNYMSFRLPPNGTRQSMDSAVILATLFVLGLNTALYVILMSYLIFAIANRKIALWRHAANLWMYVLMITSASYTFDAVGGNIGFLQVSDIYKYLAGMIVYFFVNTIIIGVFHVIFVKQSFFSVLNEIFKESFSAYVSTLLLSLVLTSLLENKHFFGLFLFMIIAVLISKSFILLFDLYFSVAERAIRDQRTGLFNHGYFEDALDIELKRCRTEEGTFVLALLDLDDFKKYNDAFGHLRGDQLLEFVGGLLRKHCPNQLVARYGGEEFAVILKSTSSEEAFHFMNRVRKEINDSYFEGVELFPHGCISFSAGIAEYAKDIYDKNQLVDRADQAMYYAKAQGKNAVHVYNEDSLLQRTIDIESDIREIEQQLNIFLSKDVYTFQHSKRVYRYAVEMSDRLTLTDVEKKMLVLGALIHDIGKLEIPRDVLNKKGKLTQEEWEMVKKHVLWGKEIASTNEKFKPLLPLIELHHERYDGTGYPRGLKGGEIPKLARALCIIDSFDAMTTERPYQQTKTFAEAIVELRKFAGIQFDPELVEPFISIIEEKCEEDALTTTTTRTEAV